jgi:hypothetical protein
MFDDYFTCNENIIGTENEVSEREREIRVGEGRGRKLRI